MPSHFLLDFGIVAVLILAAALLVWRGNRVRGMHVVGVCLLSLCMAVAFFILDLASTRVLPDGAIRLEGTFIAPFVGMIETVRMGIENVSPQYIFENLVVNILLFIPLGILVPMLWKTYRALWKTALFAMATALAGEVVRLALGGGMKFDNLIFGALGGAAGYGIYRLLRRLARKFVKRWGLPKSKWASPWRFFPYICVALPLITVLALGLIDRAGAAEEAQPETVQEQQQQQEPEDADVEVADAIALNSPAVGTLDIPDAQELTVMSQLNMPPVTATPSEADQKAIAALFSGKELREAQPLEMGDLVIQIKEITLDMDTSKGVATASAEGKFGGLALSAEELATLGQILSNYEISLAQPEA